MLLLEWLRRSRVLSCVSATGAVFMPPPVFMPPVFMPVFMPVPGCNAPAAEMEKSQQLAMLLAVKATKTSTSERWSSEANEA